jgi:hypothetical protein
MRVTRQRRDFVSFHIAEAGSRRCATPACGEVFQDGLHTIWAGGKYDSHLLVPTIPTG